MAILDVSVGFVMAGEDAPSTGTVRIDSDIIKMMRVVCAHRDEKAVEYLSTILRGVVTADYKAVVAEMKNPETKPPTRKRKRQTPNRE